MASTKTVPVVITVAGKIVGWVGDEVISINFEKKERGLMNRVPCKNHVKNALQIKGKSFPEYLYHRMVKDNLGFVPTDDIWSGKTDCKSYIVAMAPQKQYEFLAYAHELGHCKSKQYENSEFSSIYYSSVDEYKLKNEYNAWVWALKYYRRLGFDLCKDGKKLVKEAFTSYLRGAEGLLAIKYAGLLDKQFDIGLDFTPKKIQAVVKESSERTKNWKPWHDMKAKQTKRQWRNQK